jgi:ornithine--oxo-acid transaminase
LYIIGKALGGGHIPVSAVIGSKNIVGVFTPGMHGSTFGAYPPACAAGRAFLRVYYEEHLDVCSRRLGGYFIGELRKIQSPHIKEIRGRGLFIGVELHTKARPFCEELMKEGMLCKETHDNTIRFAPPLIITKKQIDTLVKIVNKVLEA